MVVSERLEPALEPAPRAHGRPFAQPSRWSSEDGAVRALLLSLSVLLLAACGPSPARLACFDRCQVANERCVLSATTASELTSCDLRTDACLASCPP